MGARNTRGPSVSVLRCDECGKRVGRNGYLKIDRQAIAQRFQVVGDWEVIDTKTDRVYWHILHAECDTNPQPADFRLAGHLFSTTSDLLEATLFCSATNLS